jgi:hypothetical protein
MNYVPHYSEKTSVKRGEAATAQDVMAKQQLRKEAGLRCINEVWVPNEGILPLFQSSKELTIDEQNLLCVTPFTPTPQQIMTIE